MAEPLGRREFLAAAVLLSSTALDLDAAAAEVSATATATDGVTELSVSELTRLLDSGALSAVALTQRFLERIERLDKRGPAVNAVIDLNPDAQAIAAARDAERKAGVRRGALHGIPILIKDNVDTADKLKTSAGSFALTTSVPLRDAPLVAQLRMAGAVLIGKTNLSEWANFRSTRATSGWSARGGLTKNPHVLNRNTSGSSSGTAAGVAAGFAPLGIGTETDGSIISPSAVCGIVGIKPTLGLISRSGIVPIAVSQDTAGPMARTVSDAAILLGALTASDAGDGATNSAGRRVERDYSKFLDRTALAKARIGVPRDLAGFHPEVDRALDEAIAALKAAGAVVLDGLKLGPTERMDEAEQQVLLYEFKAGVEAYLAGRGPASPLKTLADLLVFNEGERAREMPFFGQELFEQAWQKGPLSEPAYRAARARCVQLSRAEGLDRLFGKHALDAVICPSNPPAWLTDLTSGDHVIGGNTSFAAVSGYPSITVPMGMTHELPLGLSFVGRPWGEGRLISLAYAFEQQTLARRPPRFLSTVD